MTIHSPSRIGSRRSAVQQACQGIRLVFQPAQDFLAASETTPLMSTYGEANTPQSLTR